MGLRRLERLVPPRASRLRVFARYSAAERRSLGERAGRAGEPPVAARPGFDESRARGVLPTIALLLGEDPSERAEARIPATLERGAAERPGAPSRSERAGDDD